MHILCATGGQSSQIKNGFGVYFYIRFMHVVFINEKM